jgi:PilZ domain
MLEKVYITSKQMATFVCPKCEKSKTVNVAQYANLDKMVKVKVKCPCGYAYTSILEKRKKYRKETNLHGSFIRLVDGRETTSGLMTVRDLSMTGMKLHINGNHGCEVGDVIKVEFYLDDAQRSLIRKKVIIRNIYRSEIGTELAPTEAVDKALGFYLFS